MSEKLCIKWTDFQDNITTAFVSLRNDNNFSDVTLACEDGNQVEAHKVILAASSPFFQNILRKNKHPHPLIYMRGMTSEDLVAIVDFLYYGEANVYQENIDPFLAIAEELNLQGLTGNGNTKVDQTSVRPATERKQDLQGLTGNGNTKVDEPSERKQGLQNNKIKTEKNQSYIQEETHNKPHPAAVEQDETAVAVPNSAVYSVQISDIQDLDDQVSAMMRKSENFCRGGSRKADTCTVCGKEGPGQNIKDHIETNHLEGVSIPCSYCEKKFRTRSALRKHVCHSKSEFSGPGRL